MRRLLLVLGTIVLLLVAAAGAGIAALQTDTGRSWLAATISGAASSADARVVVTGLSGFVPSDMRIARIEIADRDGAWLDITDAALELRLGDLLRRQLTVRRLAAEGVTVMRAPHGPAEPTSAKPPSDKSEPFTLPHLPVRVVVDEIAIKRLSLAEDLLGQSVALELSGQGRLGDNEAVAQLAIDRVDGTAGHARLDFGFDRQRSLALHLDVVEPSGVLLKDLPDQPGPLPLTISIHGDGPLDGWRGTVQATAGSDARVDATVMLAAGEQPRLSGEGTLAIQSLLPAKFRPVLQQPVKFAIAATLPGEKVVLERLSLDSGALTLTANGTFDRADQRFSAQAEVGVPELQPLEAVTGVALNGSATAKLAADGTMDAPRIDVDAAATNLRGVVGAQRISAKLHATRGGTVWTTHGTGDVAGFTAPAPRPGLPDALDWALDATFDQAASLATVQALTVRARGVEIAATGRAETLDQSPRGQARIDIKATDLAAWQEAAGQALSGRLSLGTDLTFDANAMTAKFAGKGEDLVTGQPPLDALLGGRLDLRGSVRRSADGALAADEVDISGANVSASGSATANADFSVLDARLKLDAPRLVVLSKALGTPTQGAVSIQSHFTGSLERLAAQIEATGQQLRFGTQRADRLTATASLTDALAPSGTLTLAARAGKLDANLDTAFARPSPDVIEISRLSLRAPGSEMNGAAKINTRQLGANGALSLRVTDLSPWSALAGAPLAGAANARITLTDKDGQRADVDGSFRNLRFGEAQSAERVRIEARLTDLLRKPGGRARVDASSIALPDLRIDRLQVNAQAAKPETYSVSLETRGVLRPDTAAQPLLLATTSEITLAGTEQRIRVTQLTGRVGSYNIVSHAPLSLSMATNRFKLDGLDLTIGQGRVTAAAARDGSRLSLQTQIRSLPLALVELAMPTQKISGTLDGTVQFAGTAAQPDGQIDLSLRDVRTGSAPNLPSLSLSSQGRWKGQSFDIAGTLAVKDLTKLDIRATVPAKLDAATLMPGLIENGPLSASVKGDGRLEHWAALLPTGEDRVGGHYVIDLAVGGTPAVPQPQGRVALDDGSYVSFAAGTQIKNLNAEVIGNGRRFELTRLIGTDGGTGTLDGRGAVDLGAGNMIDASVRFANFTFARRDDVTASGDGMIQFVGTPQAGKLSGQLRLDRAEMRIPERLPPSIPNLPVIVIDSNSGQIVSEPEHAAHDSMIVLDLNLDIPARAFVRGRGLDSEWRGNMHVGGTTGAPQLRGRLETVRGDVSLLGKRFSLTDSNITFVGGEKIDPQLAITAEHRAAAITAQVEITGTASSPTIKLTSQPEMPQDEVLSRVLFGRSVSEMTPAQGLELAQAAASLAGGGGPGLLDKVRSAVGLDRLDIGTPQQASGTNGSSGASGATVTAGKYVTDRVFLGVEQGRDQGSTRSKVEVEITPNITAETSFGNSAAGAGVNWKWDY